jgi:hypothetical protein
VTNLTNQEIQRYAPSCFAGQAHESRSSRYTFLPTIDVIDGLRDAGFHPVMACQSRTRVAGKQFFTKHMLRFRSTDQTAITVGDSLLETVLVNSHDGTSSYQVMLGVFRLVCSNGMIVGDTFDSVKVRHVGNIVEDVVKATANLLSNAPKLMELINIWRSIMLTTAEQLAFATAAHQLIFTEGSNIAQAITPDRLLAVRRGGDQGSDLYTTFNRVQEAAVRGGIRGNRLPGMNRLRSRSVESIDRNVNLNKSLWTLAEEMAKLKG